MRMELIENLLQLLVTFVGALLSGISYRKSGRQAYFLLLCFYGCFALGALYWTLYLLLFDTTPKVFYVSEFGWVASVIFLRILQATLAGADEHSFRCRRAWLAPAFGVPLLAFYCTFGDILSNLIWCGMMIVLSYCAIRGLVYANGQTGAARRRRTDWSAATRPPERSMRFADRTRSRSRRRASSRRTCWAMPRASAR